MHTRQIPSCWCLSPSLESISLFCPPLGKMWVSLMVHSWVLGYFMKIILKRIKERTSLRTQKYIVLDFPASFEVRKEINFTGRTFRTRKLGGWQGTCHAAVSLKWASTFPRAGDWNYRFPTDVSVSLHLHERKSEFGCRAQRTGILCQNRHRLGAQGLLLGSRFSNFLLSWLIPAVQK